MKNNRIIVLGYSEYKKKDSVKYFDRPIVDMVDEIVDATKEYFGHIDCDSPNLYYLPECKLIDDHSIFSSYLNVHGVSIEHKSKISFSISVAGVFKYICLSKPYRNYKVISKIPFVGCSESYTNFRERKFSGKLGILVDMIYNRNNPDESINRIRKEIIRSHILSSVYYGKKALFVNIPAFGIKDRDKKGIGKTSEQQKACMLVSGGSCFMDMNDKNNDFKRQLASKYVSGKRAIVIDNVTSRNSEEIERLIPLITNGEHVHASPKFGRAVEIDSNEFSFFMSTNERNITPDAIHRSIIMEVEKFDVSSNVSRDWGNIVDSYIEKYRDEIISECVSVVRENLSCSLARYERMHPHIYRFCHAMGYSDETLDYIDFIKSKCNEDDNASTLYSMLYSKFNGSDASFMTSEVVDVLSEFKGRRVGVAEAGRILQGNGDASRYDFLDSYISRISGNVRLYSFTAKKNDDEVDSPGADGFLQTGNSGGDLDGDCSVDGDGASEDFVTRDRKILLDF